MRIAVVDNEQYQVREIEKKINHLYKDVFAIDGFFEKNHFLEAFKYERYDLVYLDIELNNMHGIGMIDELKEIYADVMIVLMIARDNDYHKSYIVDDCRFLEKPIDNESFNSLLERAIYKYQMIKRRVLFKTYSGTYIIPVSKIVLLETSYKDYKLHTVDKVYYGSVKHLTDIRERLCLYNFMQVHRSYTINFEYVVKYEYHDVYLVNGIMAPVARSKVTEFKRLIAKYVKTW